MYFYFSREPTTVALLEAAVKRLSFTLQPTTARAYTTALHQFSRFNAQHHFPQRHITLDALLAYIEHLAQKDYTQGTMNNHLSAMKFLANVQGSDMSVFESFYLKCMVRSIKNTLVYRKKEKYELSPKQILRMCIGAGEFGDDKYVIRLGLIFGFLGLLRVSSYTVDPIVNNRWDLITTISDCKVKEGSLHVELKKTKTRHNAGTTVVIIPEIDSEFLSAKTNFNNMKELYPLCDFNFTPVLPLKSGAIMSPYIFNAILKYLASNVCDYSNCIASHALRRSGTTHLYKAGATPLELTKAGTWSSETYLAYILSKQDNISIVQAKASSMFEF